MTKEDFDAGRLGEPAASLYRACEAAQEWLRGWASAEPYLQKIDSALTAARAARPEAAGADQGWVDPNGLKLDPPYTYRLNDKYNNYEVMARDGEHGVTIADNVPTEYRAKLIVDALVNYRAARPEAGWREEDKWLVWSNQHRAWWRPNSCGYTVYLKAAGRYTRAEALDICRKARNGWLEGEPPTEIPVLARDAEFCSPTPPTGDKPDA